MAAYNVKRKTTELVWKLNVISMMDKLQNGATDKNNTPETQQQEQRVVAEKDCREII